MNPNAALDALRVAIARWSESEQNDPYSAEDIVDCAEALDQWLSKGGVLPEAWVHARPATDNPREAL